MSKTKMPEYKGLYLIMHSKTIEKPLIDTLGVPLGEGKSPAHIKAQANIQYSACPFQDSRKHGTGKMNSGAMKRVNTNLSSILSYIVTLRELYSRDLVQGPSRSFSFIEAFYFVSSVKHLVLFLWSREEKKLILDPVLADVYKVFLGLNLLFEKVFYSYIESGVSLVSTYINAHQLFELTDTLNLLNGKEESCPASKNMITSVLELIVDGSTDLLKNPTKMKIPIRKFDDLYRFAEVDRFTKLAYRIHLQGFFFHHDLSAMNEEVALLAHTVGINLKAADYKSTISLSQRRLISNRNPLCQLRNATPDLGYKFVQLLALEKDSDSLYLKAIYMADILEWLEHDYLALKTTDPRRGAHLYKCLFSNPLQVLSLNF